MMIKILVLVLLMTGCKQRSSSSRSQSLSKENSSESLTCGADGYLVTPKGVPGDLSDPEPYDDASVPPVDDLPSDSSNSSPTDSTPPASALALTGASNKKICRNGPMLTNLQLWQYSLIAHCYQIALVPEGTGGGFLGNILGNPKCTDVEEVVSKSVSQCVLATIKNKNIAYLSLEVLPCSIMHSGTLSDHIYMGICLKNQTTLVSWTDPWKSLTNFYCPGTGQNSESDEVNLTM